MSQVPFFLKPIVQFLIAVISSSTLTQSFTLFPLSLSDLPGVLLAISVIVRRRSLFDWLSVTSSLSGGFMYGCQIKHAHLAPHVTPQLFNWWSPNLDSRGQEENKRDYFSFPLCILLLPSTAKLYCIVYLFSFEIIQLAFCVPLRISAHKCQVLTANNRTGVP